MSPLRSSAGPAVCTNGASSSLGDDLRERRLARARAGRRAARGRAPRRGPRPPRASTRELLAQRLLADELVERARAQRAVELVLARRARRASGCAASAPASGSAPRGLQRARDQVLGAVALGDARAARRPPAGEKPSPSRPSRASAPRVVAAGDDDRGLGAVGRRDLLAQLDDDPLGGALADPRARPGSAPRRRRRPRRRSSRGVPPERTRARPSARRAWTPSSSRNRSRSSSVAKP